MATSSIFRRGKTWFVRFNVPQDRWADVGRAMGAASGLKRELVRTLQTTDHREAQQRRDVALSSIRAEIDRELVTAKLRPLTDWTADWEAKAVQHRESMRLHGNDALDEQSTASEVIREMVERDAEIVERRQGRSAARHFATIALTTELTVAHAGRQWLVEEQGKVKNGTIQSHKGAFKKLGAYLVAYEGFPSLEGVAMTAVSRCVAGEVMQELRSRAAAETAQRDFSAYSGLWRWRCGVATSTRTREQIRRRESRPPRRTMKAKDRNGHSRRKSLSSCFEPGQRTYHPLGAVTPQPSGT